MPTVANFLLFIRNTMRINTTVLPDNSPWIQWSYNYALMIVNQTLQLVGSVPPENTGWSIYAIAVYNLAGDTLINYSPDQDGQDYFTQLRGSTTNGGYGISDFAPGVVQSVSDVSTSTGMLVPDFMKELTLSDLQLLKTPYGRQYLALAQKFGTLWGLT